MRPSFDFTGDYIHEAPPHKQSLVKLLAKLDVIDIWFNKTCIIDWQFT